MSGFTEFLKSDRSFYKYTKQTILHVLYRLLVTCMVFFGVLLTAYILADESKCEAIKNFLYILGIIILFIILLIATVYVYYIFIKKDPTALQSEDYQIAKELLTKVQGDSISGMVVVDGIKSISQRGGENQNGSK